ncbi:MAG: hypothetical protein HRU35_01980 [Rickettsiaceae bacterium]|nr:hypothetical protein [Rickettsiaceae bacterium]
MSYISVVIFVRNEINNLITAINSIKNIAAEIIIISSNDNKDISIIADKYGGKLIFGKWRNDQQQKLIAEKSSENNWLLVLESNEELSYELQDEIEYIFADKKQDRYSAYIIPFRSLVKDKMQPRFFAPVSKLLRLYDKTKNMSKKINNSYELNGIAYQRLGNDNIKYKFKRFCTMVKSCFF